VLLLGLLVGAGGWYLGVGQYTQAPSLLGMTRAQALVQVAKAGLKLDVGETRHSETAPVGTVVDQDPGPTGRIRRDGAVTVYLSSGPERHAVPDVVGSARVAAEQAVLEANLAPMVRQAYDDKVRKGLVISTKPKAGTPLRRDTAVTLVVSKGPPPVRLPDVRGDRATDVVRQLQGLGLKVTTSERFDDQAPEGTVISQSPGAGTVLKGSTVQLTVSKGAPFVTVPDVRGMTFDEARAKLQASGLNAEHGVDIPGGSGRVINQNPSGDTQVRKGSTVVLHTF
jgi:serine/threonine-protein kinase